MSNAAKNQKTYCDRVRDEVIVLKCPVRRDVIIDLIHAAGVVITLPPSRRDVQKSVLSPYQSRTEQHRDDLLAADKVAR
jgi:hypothetical protein